MLFIAGPIQGAPDYQTPLAERVIQKTDKVLVASPRRTVLPEHFDYDEQVDWEQVHLGRAATNGVCLFWLEARDFSLPYEKGRPFAKTTFGEFNYALGRKRENPAVNITMGIHPDYSKSGGISERNIRSMARRAGLPVYGSIAETEAAALADIERIENYLK